MPNRMESQGGLLVPGGEALVLKVNQSKIVLHLDTLNRRMWVGDVGNYLNETMMTLFRFVKVPNQDGSCNHGIWIMVKNHQVMEDEFGEEVEALIEYFQSLAN